MKAVMGAGFIAATLLAACGPSDKQKAQWAEEKRIECLDKVCDGDVPPKVALDESVMKLNGQWFIAPRRYAMGFAGLAFYWPSKTPATGRADGQSYPERGQDFYDVGIEVFLTGRQRWPTPKVEKPWENSSWQVRWNELQAQGLRMERTTLNAGLDLVRFQQADGKPYSYSYYIATGQQRIRGSGPPVLSCLEGTPPRPEDSCTSGEFWQPDVYADFRFNIKHAPDWPAIHEEIVRVLNLSRKAQP